MMIFDVPVPSLWTQHGPFLLSGDKLPAAERSTQWAIYILSVDLWLLDVVGFGFKLGTTNHV